ncbi:MAG TPA: hypothetical protein VFV38_44460 [Ktedonobacteraceae bacterium]|nr:hypothetical protein [Ktedonobacteraceae bacterium]
MDERTPLNPPEKERAISSWPQRREAAWRGFGEILARCVGAFRCLLLLIISSIQEGRSCP